MIRRILFVFCALLLVMVGYTVARLEYDPEMHLLFHKKGIISFCDLSEIDRLRLCPQARIAQKMVTDGATVFYICNGSEGYIETIDLSEVSKAGLKAKISGLPGNVEKVCGTKYGEVFHVTTNPRIYK